MHWHMSDTQSFPFQSKSAPRLWDGSFSIEERYSQLDARELVEYARLRGIRVVVEFDVPGHAGSWCTGYPEICPRPDCLQPLNVASNRTFEVIESLMHECTGGVASAPGKPSGIFPDNFIHLGGDEVDTSCWKTTPVVAEWLSSVNMTEDDGYAYFVKRVAGMAIAQHHRPVQWSEVYDHFGNSLPKETIIHIWKSVTNVSAPLAGGYNVLLNVGCEC
jgi:hexosaminidase